MTYLRVLAREKGFSSLAIATLALGIGAVTTIFSVVNSVLLKPLAYSDPGRLYAATESSPKLAHLYPKFPVNTAHFFAWKGQCGSCLQEALLKPNSFNLTGEGDPERIDGVSTTWELFQVLGVQPRLGRAFSETDDQPGNNKCVVITDSLWRRRFQANRDIVGNSIRLNDEQHVVIGVLPAGFRFPGGDQLGPILLLPGRAEIYKPLGLNWAKQRRVGNFSYLALIRLRPGATAERAQAEMTAALGEAAREMGIELKAHLTGLQDQMTGNSRAALWLLMAAVGAVLLIVCVNLGNLMLVRSSGRLRDAAIRRALGASSGQLFRAIIGESLVLSFAGGMIGVLLAYAGVQVLVNTGPIDIPRLDEVQVDIATLLFAFVISAGCGILCGLWPALRWIHSQPVDALKGGARSTTDSGGTLLAREWLAALEVTLSTVLLIVAALLGVSFLRLMSVERGFEVDRVLTANVTLPDNRYQKDEQKSLFHRQILEKLQTLPGVKTAALVSVLPLKGEMQVDVITKGGETRPLVERPLANYRFISSNYFQTMGIALRQGRLLTEADRSGKVALISESAARKVWPGENAIGKRIQRMDIAKAPMSEVIGVVADIRTVSLDKQPPLMVYVPYWEQGNVPGNVTYLVRTAQDPSALANVFRGAVRGLDSELPLADVRTMREILTESVGRRRFQTLLAAVFAVSALLLACLGIYGVISYSVARRTNEIGIRMALGAQAIDLRIMVLRQGMRPVLAGLVLGVLAALWAGQLIRSFLFGVGASDPLTICFVAILLLGVAAMACWVPAWRASRIDPMVALHYE